MLRDFEECGYVVVPCGSCAHEMIRGSNIRIFSRRAQRASERALRLCERTDELNALSGTSRSLTRCPALDATVTYHDSCSGLRELGVKAQPRAVPGWVPD